MSQTGYLAALGIPRFVRRSEPVLRYVNIVSEAINAETQTLLSNIMRALQTSTHEYQVFSLAQISSINLASNPCCLVWGPQAENAMQERKLLISQKISLPYTLQALLDAPSRKAEVWKTLAPLRR